MIWNRVDTIAKKVKSGDLSAVGQVNKSIYLIKETKNYNSVLSINKDGALLRAREIDLKAKKKQATGRLAGVPFIAKDNFLSYGVPTTAASHMLENFIAPYQSTAIERLEAEGAILVAKANLDAFAHGSSTENSAFGPTLNPHDIARVPGGSSGGSAAAVALGLVPFALGTDTGGSIRLPASYCGVVGYKPTYGLVSRYGVVAMASSTDVIGPLTNNVEDSALLLDIISGRDFFDGTTIERDTDSYCDLKLDIKGQKIGVIKEYFNKGLNDDVRSVIETSIKKLKNAGAQIVEVSLPSVELALACYYIIVPAEVSSNLSRYDGQRYGLSAPEAKDLYDSYELARERGFEAENKRRIMMGTYVLSSGYYEAYYKRAQTVRTKLINEFNDVFCKVDFLLGPTAPTTAFKLGTNSDNPLTMYMADVMTVSSNLAGLPAISLPAGLSKNLPVGLQLMAPQKHDRRLLAIAKLYEEINK